MNAVNQIKNTGAYNAGEIVPKAVCRELSAEMDKAFSGERSDLAYRINERTGIGHILNPLGLHPAVLKYATHPFLLAVIERYLGRRIYLADIDLRLVPPMPMSEVDHRSGTKELGYTSSHWHRDIRGHQVKVMIYLTDVGERDNNFAYLPGTHKGYQNRPRKVENSRFTDEEVSSYPAEIVECYGAAGTTLIFDTNPIHRLRRKSDSSTRYSITFYYTPGQELRKLDIDLKALEGMEENLRNIFGGTRIQENL